MTIQTKICRACKLEKSIYEFHKYKRGEYGVKADCKVCIKEYNKKYYIKNMENRKAYSYKYRFENKEIVHKYNKKYKLKNKSVLNDYEKNYKKNRKSIYTQM